MNSSAYTGKPLHSRKNHSKHSELFSKIMELGDEDKLRVSAANRKAARGLSSSLLTKAARAGIRLRTERDGSDLLIWKRPPDEPERPTFKHGESAWKERKNTREYSAWRAMMGRCLKKSGKLYEYYGARGITVCQRWRESYPNFLSDMGRCPPGMTLDRWPNNDGNYEPGNCRWATHAEQQYNRRKPQPKTHCKHGHEFTSENTAVLSNGERACKECRRRNQIAYMQRKRAAA